jgi:hypothetical protein
MADVVHPGPAATPTPTRHYQHGGPLNAGQIHHRARSFRNVLAQAVQNIQPAAARILVTPRSSKPGPAIPAQSDVALQQAMKLEGVPQSWQAGLRFIMEKESGGQVGVKNPVHSARGLFQLTAANYHLNPNGARSFGNGVEEAQGGIRYIQQRYGSADNAVAFWQQHHWY